MSRVLTPTVWWAQSGREVWLKMDMREVKAESVCVNVRGGNRLTVTAESRNSEGPSYRLELELYGDVSPSFHPDVLASSVSISLTKSSSRYDDPDDPAAASWPRLLAGEAPVDKNKIKVDWDRWVDEEAARDAAAEAQAAREKIEVSKAWAAESERQTGKPHPYSAAAKAGGSPADLMGGGGGLPGMSAAEADAYAAMVASRTSAGFRATAQDPALLALPTRVRLKASYMLAYNIFVILGVGMVLFLAAQSCWINFFPRRGPIGGGGAVTPGQMTAAAANATASALIHQGGLTNAFDVGLGSLHARVGSLQYGVQALASLEVLHALLGLIAGRVLPSVLLNGGRDIILYGVIACLPSVQSHWSVGLLYVLWCVGDLSRYAYYLSALISSSVPTKLVAESWLGVAVVQGLEHRPTQKFMLWLRYTLPLVLLPFGFAAELWVLYEALAPASQLPLLGSQWTLSHLLQLYALLAYLLGAPFLYMAVLKQRRSKLGKQQQGKGKRVAGAASTSSASASASTSSSASTKETKKAQ